MEIVDTDDFMDMPGNAQLLYFHLGMRADDDGFVASPKRVMSNVGAETPDLRLLAEKGYIILFESGVCMIRDWNTNNVVRRDTYTPTRYQKEKNSVSAAVPDAVQDVAQDVTQDVTRDVTQNVTPVCNTGKVSSGKDRTGKERSEKDSEGQDSEGKKRESAAEPPRTRFSPPKVEEVEAYCRERHNGLDAKRFVDYYSANGWTQGRGKPILDWKAAVRTWEGREKNERHDLRTGRNDTSIPGIRYF